MPGLHMSAYAPPGSMAWSAPQYPAAAMSTQSMLSPGLKFFIERDDGSLVPLLPVDELPDDIRLAGVPLGLSPSQVKGMVFLGHDPSVDRKFSHAEFLSINEPGAPVPVVMRYTPEVVPHINHVPQLIQVQPLPAHIPAFIPPPTPPNSTRPKPLYNERPPPPSGIEPDQEKKIYCNYWCQTGQCGFIQQGCIYKHEMPEDKETLNLIGLKSVPAWWRKEQARKKSKVKRNERNGSSSEWEVVERQQTDTSALHSDDPVRVRVPPPRSAGISVIKQAAQKSRPALFAQKDLAISDVPSETATAGSSAPGSSSPPGGVRLGAAKTPMRGPPFLPFRKQTLESPIEDEAGEDLIDFNVLVPSSSPDFSSPPQSSPGARVNSPPKAVVESRRSKIVTKGGVAISTGRGTRSSISSRGRRGSADKKIGPVSPTRQQNITIKGMAERGRERVEQSNSGSRRDRARMGLFAGVTAKALGEAGI